MACYAVKSFRVVNRSAHRSTWDAISTYCETNVDESDVQDTGSLMRSLRALLECSEKSGLCHLELKPRAERILS
jgi:hypothetical protein